MSGSASPGRTDGPADPARGRLTIVGTSEKARRIQIPLVTVALFEDRPRLNRSRPAWIGPFRSRGAVETTNIVPLARRARRAKTLSCQHFRNLCPELWISGVLMRDSGRPLSWGELTRQCLDSHYDAGGKSKLGARCVKPLRSRQGRASKKVSGRTRNRVVLVPFPFDDLSGA